MNKLYVAFLWHMHQPLYKDPLSGKYSLPWVRLHSIKGYNDMLSILEGFPKVRQTFNLVPSLMAQIEDYISGEASDIFLEVSRKSPEELTPDERVFILQNFFSASWETMVFIYPRYKELLEKRGRRSSLEELEKKQAEFSTDEIRDLQVWFNLTWFGYAARDEDEQLRKIIEKGRGFTEQEKHLVLDKQFEVMRSLLPRYKAAQDSGQVEVSVSPFYHPILPLLCDLESAREAMPKIKLPKEKFHYPEDARWQVNTGVSYYERIFGRKPRGMWPSEGSVSDETAKIIAEAGIQWMATDEEVLLNTIKRRRGAELIYTPYRLQLGGASIDVVFRDKNLSDLIGFSYSKSGSQASAEDLMGHLNNIQRALDPSGGEHLVSIILDGENAWEYYPDGGKEFLSRFYSLLSDSDTIEATTIGDYLEQHPPRMELGRIFSGSWIGHNFNIWIGRREDNLAWDLLARTREHTQKKIDSSDLSPETKERVWSNIYAAEGSDWFWWYGDDFSSAFDAEFDLLFRSHLIQAHRLMGDEVPSYLNEPVLNLGAARPTEQPTGFMKPIIDGRLTHYYEWVAAGNFDVRKAGGAMNISETVISEIFWGFDKATLFLRLDPTAPDFLSDGVGDMKLMVHFDLEKQVRIEITPPSTAGEKAGMDIWKRSDGDEWSRIEHSEEIGVNKIVEFSVGFNLLEVKAGDDLRFHVTAHKGEIEIERWPRGGYIEYPAPGEDFEATMWFV